MIRPTTPSNPSTPPRSTTFPAKSAHRHHHSHRHHQHHHHDKSVPQSALVPATSNPFGDFLSTASSSRTDGKTDGGKTPPGGLEQHQQQEQQREQQQQGTEKGKGKEQDGETWKEVERLKARRKAIDEDLRTRLGTLSTLSTTTTRRLDYTYYSLLSSLSSLTSAISSLSALSAQIATLHTTFTSSTSSLTAELKTQISASDGSFDAQARRISQLETRIKKGREKVGKLGERLDGVREKVERSSLRDRESRRIVGRRLKMLWGFLGSITGLFLILATTRHWRGNEYAMKDEVVHLVNRTEGAFGEVVGVQSDGKQGTETQQDDEGLRPDVETRLRVKETTAGSGARISAVDADAALRLFDEL